MHFSHWKYLSCRLAAGEEALHRSASAKEAEAVPGMAQDTLQTLLDSLSAAGADAAEARARKILLGLGFKTQQMDAPTSRLSGKLVSCELYILLECTVVWEAELERRSPCTGRRLLAAFSEPHFAMVTATGLAACCLSHKWV